MRQHNVVHLVPLKGKIALSHLRKTNIDLTILQACSTITVVSAAGSKAPAGALITMLDKLPFELLYAVLSYLRPSDCPSLMRTGRRYHVIVQPELWLKTLPSLVANLAESANPGADQRARVVEYLFAPTVYDASHHMCKQCVLREMSALNPVATITSLSINVSGIASHRSWSAVQQCLTLPHLQTLHIRGLSLDTNNKFFLDHEASALNLRRLSITNCAASEKDSDIPWIFVRMLRSVSYLTHFTIEMASYSQQNIDQILTGLRSHQEALEHLIIASVSGESLQKTIYRPINLQHFTSLSSLALPVAFLYWDFLSDRAVFTRLPNRLRRLQLQFHNPRVEWGDDYPEHRARTLMQSMETFADCANEYCSALRNIWWWYPVLGQHDSWMDEPKDKSSDTDAIYLSLRELVQKPAAIAESFAVKDILYECISANRLTGTPLGPCSSPSAV